MRKILLIVPIIFLLSGCISMCGSCDDSNPCTKDYCEGFSCAHESLDGSQPLCNTVVPPCKIQSCVAGQCELVNITGCCGNGICESNEDITNCAADCAASVKLECNATDPIVPILMKLEDELEVSLIQCDVTNLGAGKIDAQLTAQIPGWSNEFSKSVTLNPGLTQTVDIELDWKEKFYTNKESADAAINFKVISSNVTIASSSEKVKISPKEDIFWSVDVDNVTTDLTYSIAAWVTPHDPCISSLISKAKELAPGRSLGGYANYGGLNESEKANRTSEQAKAIFYAIKGQGVSYVNTPISFSGSQHIKMPADSLIDKSGNCVDGTVLFASAFEALGMEPIMVIIPYHTLVGVETYPGSNKYLFIETTVVGSDSYEAAVNNGNEQFNEYKDTEEINVIKFSEYRENVTPFPSYSNCSLDLKCSDGTSAGACSANKPKLCTGTGFVDAASVCGCPDNYYALGDSCVSAVIKSEKFVLGTSGSGRYYFWTPNLLGGGKIAYKYVVSSNKPVKIFILPSSEDFDKLKSGSTFMHYPSYEGTNTLSYDQVAYHEVQGGIAILNEGGSKATVDLKVLYAPG
jgi:hypothetical protein